MYENLRFWTGSFIRANSGTNSLAGPSDPHHLHMSHYPSAQMDEFPHSLAFSTVILGGGRIICKTLNHIQGGSWSRSPQKPILFLSNYNEKQCHCQLWLYWPFVCKREREGRGEGTLSSTALVGVRPLVMSMKSPVNGNCPQT